VYTGDTNVQIFAVRLAAAKQEFQKMLDAEVVHRSSSCWSSPLHMVKKKCGGWRPCGDFRRLNAATAEDKYPLPNMGDLSACLDECIIFSKLDLQKGYYQVPVGAADIHKTAVIMPFGLFEFIRMSFGLKNPGITFQRLMDHFFFDLPFCFMYLDDLLVASRSANEHHSHLRQALRRLQENGLVINCEKCVFGRPEVEFLGHKVTAGSVSPLPERVAAIRQFPRPKTVRDLQAFLGLFNFYWRFVPAAAAILRPLTDALAGAPRGTAAVEWNEAREAAFIAAREALTSTALLDHPAADAQLALVTDASATHAGPVLQQRRRGQPWRPLGFFSQKLSAAEARYSAFDRELLAVYTGILHFRHLLEGCSFTIFTDHLLLLGALTRVTEPGSDRQWSQLSFIAEFSTELRHIKGQSNVVADTLSWPLVAAAVQLGGGPLPSSPQAGSTSMVTAAGLHLQPGTSPAPSADVAAAPAARAPQSPVDIRDLARAQPACPNCQRAVHSPSLKVVSVDLQGQAVLVDISSGVMRPLVPAQFCRRIFDAVHSLAHPGIRATNRLIASRYLWPNLAAEVTAWCREYLHCQ
jgi:hypothetical protein